eukprot:TRINITY_DN33740_c0_g1_i1.p1 TRINITY_DN33740_c0_g1~~TRINITY_DN33740_c0_g1_i1.p1  ORF type:complete len:323 (+),score=28.59 TRINITY_DN33740_c0_g1_i1:63-971(+)
MQPNVQNVKTSLHNWWNTLSIATRLVFCLCIGVYVLQLFGIVSVYGSCTGGYQVLGKWQLSRLFLSPVVHAGLLHLLFNMLALLQLLPPLERSHGTSGGLVICVVYTLLSQLIAITPSTIMHTVGVEWIFDWKSCMVGLSGLLFGLLTLEVTTDETGLFPSKRVIFGFAIPSKAYPWVMLFLLQLFMPSAAFLGHLGGILSAHLVPPTTMRKVITTVDNSMPSTIKSSPAYIPANRAPLPSSNPGDVTGWSWATKTGSATQRSSSERFPGQGRALKDRSASPAASPKEEETIVVNVETAGEE